MTVRVIQWATGAVGGTTLRAIIEHPDLELVGVWVHSADKAGKDAGELVGLPPTGVLATNDRDALIALEADVVVHCPAGQGPIEGRDRDVFDLLRSGKNVVSSTGPWFVPELRSPEYLRQIEDACREGGTTLMSAGANPDVVVPWLGAALTRMSLDVDHIHLAEIDDFSPNPNLNTAARPSAARCAGCAEQACSPLARRMSRGWGPFNHHCLLHRRPSQPRHNRRRCSSTCLI